MPRETPETIAKLREIEDAVDVLRSRAENLETDDGATDDAMCDVVGAFEDVMSYLSEALECATAEAEDLE